MAARREGQRRVLVLPPPPAPAAAVPPIIMRRGRERTDLPAFLMLLGASALVMRSASAGVTPSSPSGDRVLAGFLLWLLGVVLLCFHREQRLRRLFVGHRLLRGFF